MLSSFVCLHVVCVAILVLVWISLCGLGFGIVVDLVFCFGSFGCLVV